MELSRLGRARVPVFGVSVLGSSKPCSQSPGGGLRRTDPQILLCSAGGGGKRRFLAYTQEGCITCRTDEGFQVIAFHR